MAFTFFEDRMAPFDMEDPEEKRKRLEEEQKRLGQTEVGSTTEKTYMDGSKTITQTREVPSQQAVLRPGQGGQFMRPVMRGPVSPDDFQRIQQIESGGRQFTPQGQVVTSPKGAMGISQIMPRTAMDPGYGLPNIFELAQRRGIQVQNRDEATARQLLSNQELNTEFGRNYFNKMNQMYGPEAGAAAYNAGPGRVQQALQRSQQTGQPLQQFLPQETQQYLQKFGQGRGPVSPEQVQQQTQQAQQEPTTAQLGELGINTDQRLLQPSVGAGAEGTEGEYQAQTRLLSYKNQFEQNQDNIDALLALRKDPNAPLNFKDLASERATELLTTERNKLKAQEEAEKIKNDPNAIKKVLQSEPEDEKGSWLKFFILGFISPEAGRIEAAKLGLIPTTYQSATLTNADGTMKSVQIKMRADGKVMGGRDLQGNTLSPEDLDKAVSQTTGKKVTTGADAFKDPSTGKIYYRQNDERGNLYFTEPGGGRFTGDTSKLQRVSDVSAIQRIDAQTAAELFKKNQGNVAKVLTDYAIKLGRGLEPNEEAFIRNMVPQMATQAQAQPAQPVQAQTQAQPAQAQAQAQQVQRPAQQAQVVSNYGAQVKPVPSLGELERQGAVLTKAQEQFVSKTVPEINKAGEENREISTIRREQLNIIKSNPSILDIYNGQGGQSEIARNILGKLLTGAYNTEKEGSQDFYKEIQKLSQNSKERAALEQFFDLNTRVNSARLRVNSGSGPVSNADQVINQRANLSNIAEISPLAALQGLNRSQYVSELGEHKAAFMANNYDKFKTDIDFNRAWSKEENKWLKAHEAVSQARADFLKQYNPGPKATPQELAQFKDRVFKAFELYPNPTYDVSTGWKYPNRAVQVLIMRKWDQSGILEK